MTPLESVTCAPLAHIAAVEDPVDLLDPIVDLEPETDDEDDEVVVVVVICPY